MAETDAKKRSEAAISGVGKNIESERSGLLKAIAQGGTEGRKLFEQEKSGIQANRQAAIERAGQRASIVGGPESAGFEAIAAEPFDRFEAALGTQQRGFEGGLDARQQLFDQTLQEIGAATPVLQARAEEALVAEEARAQQAEQQRAFAEEQARLDRELAQESNQLQRDKIQFDKAKLARDEAEANQPQDTRPSFLDFAGKLGEGELAGFLQRGGQQIQSQMASELEQQIAAGREQLPALLRGQDVGNLLANPSVRNLPAVQQLAQAEQALADLRGADSSLFVEAFTQQNFSGVPQGASGLLTPATQQKLQAKPEADERKALARKAGLKSVSDIVAVEKNKSYQKAASDLERLLAVGGTKDDFNGVLSSLPAHLTRTRKLLRAQFEDSFRNLAVSERAE